MLEHFDQSVFGIPLENQMMNCVERFGTVLLKSS